MLFLCNKKKYCAVMWPELEKINKTKSEAINDFPQIPNTVIKIRGFVVQSR